jgi:hypothetical protein
VTSQCSTENTVTSQCSAYWKYLAKADICENRKVKSSSPHSWSKLNYVFHFNSQ